MEFSGVRKATPYEGFFNTKMFTVSRTKRVPAEARRPQRSRASTSEKDLLNAGRYGSYDIRWLKKMRDEEGGHPDDHLVEEFENEHGKVEDFKHNIK